MLEFFYTIFLLRWSSQFLHNTIKTPQSFGGVLKSVAYILIILYGFSAYNVLDGGNIKQADVLTLLAFLPILGILVGINIWGGSILEKTSQVHYDAMPNFKAVGRGFLGIAFIFLFFISLNIIFGFIFVMCCLLWVFLLLASLGAIWFSSKYTFENFIYIPATFFETEAYIFKLLSVNGFVFVGVIGVLVILLPFCISLWVIIKRKMLLSK